MKPGRFSKTKLQPGMLPKRSGPTGNSVAPWSPLARRSAIFFGPWRENHSSECAYQNSPPPGAGNRLNAQRGIEAIAGGSQLVSSVTTVPGVRSEFYLRTSWGSGVGILYLSPIMYWVTTTDFRDIERYRRKLAELSGNQIETIKALAREDIRRKAI